MIKAIETYYKGYRFRSRLEARWAVYFDTLGIKYEYEKEGYDLGVDGRYLPDFWLPEYDVWLEVKGQEPTAQEVLKLESLARQTKYDAVLVVGVPDHPIDDEYGDRLYVYMDIRLSKGSLRVRFKYHSDILCIYDIDDPAAQQKAGRYVEAMMAARAARFEERERMI